MTTVIRRRFLLVTVSHTDGSMATAFYGDGVKFDGFKVDGVKFDGFTGDDFRDFYGDCLKTRWLHRR